MPRPAGLAALGVLQLVNSTLLVLYGVLLTLGAESSAYGGGGVPFGVVVVLLGLLSLVVAFGFLTIASWGWGLGVGVCVLGIIFSFVLILYGTYTASVVVLIDLAAVYYITDGRIRAMFKKTQTTLRRR